MNVGNLEGLSPKFGKRYRQNSPRSDSLSHLLFFTMVTFCLSHVLFPPGCLRPSLVHACCQRFWKFRNSSFPSSTALNGSSMYFFMLGSVMRALYIFGANSLTWQRGRAIERKGRENPTGRKEMGKKAGYYEPL